VGLLKPFFKRKIVLSLIKDGGYIFFASFLKMKHRFIESIKIGGTGFLKGAFLGLARGSRVS
jgi:hypothetical protein